jgi:hypothetical protein
MRSFAEPTVSSTPSFSFSTRWTFPMCCQPDAAALVMHNAQTSGPIPLHLASRDMGMPFSAG